MVVDITSFTPEQRKAFQNAASLAPNKNGVASVLAYADDSSGVTTNYTTGGGVDTGTYSKNANGSLNFNPTISSASLNTPQTPLNVQTPTPTTPYNVAGLSAELAPTAQELEASSLGKDVRSMRERLLGESAFRATKEAEAGLPEQLKAQTELSSRLKTLQNEALAIPLQLQQEATGRGITAGGLRPIETAALRNNAIQALSVGSLLEASRGNITLAQDLVDRAVAQKFDPIKEEIAVKQANLDSILNDPLTTLADKNRANRQKEIQDAKAREIAKQEADQKDVRNLALTAQKYGAPSDIVQKIQNATSFNEAQVLAGQYLTDPKAKYELESARLDNVLKRAEIDKKQRETILLGQPSKTEQKSITDALREAKSSIPVMQDKIAIADALKTAPGLGSRVGTSFLSRTPQGGGFFGTIGGGIATAIKAPLTLGAGTYGDISTALSGSGQDFAGGVHKLVGGLTLDNLIAAKARGATFGALSEGELSILASSATAINDWEIKDDKGKGTGVWNIDEASFKKELDTIKTLTARAIQQSQGNIFSSEEQSALDEIFSPLETVNPANFY